ncbi:MAG: FAD-dependent oxidoreductase [Rhodothermales bacterium]|nr:FAD-dependent oxidoreductase [Rhodothermales bacterium]
MAARSVIVVGSGVFGMASAIALSRRGHNVTLFERGSIADPLAASTDISKVVRIEYGDDDLYMRLGEQAREGWIHWNDLWRQQGLQPLYHETGALMCSRSSMSPGHYEYDSFELLRARGHQPGRMSGELVAKRFPAWSSTYFQDGFYNPIGGFVESGKAMHRMKQLASAAGVRIVDNTRVEDVRERSSRVRGVTIGGSLVESDIVVLAAGAWNAMLWPTINSSIRSTGHPVFHFKPDDAALFRPEIFPTFLADVSRTGYYGFPSNEDGIVKIGKHGKGVDTDPDGPREIMSEQYDLVREFLSDAMPSLANAELVYSRLCLYADSADSDFWICEDPDCRGLFIAGAGSGHGYKFAPVIGDVIADAVEKVDNEFLDRFRWRPDLQQERGNEASRCHDIV